MKILFFDVETTGLADFDKRASDPSQPHLVQLAAMLTDGDGKVYESHNVIVKPDGWEIPKEASDVHGITNDIASAVGIPEKTVAGLLMDMIKKADVIVAHNLQFDKFLARIAMRRYEMLTDEQNDWWKALPGFCTMRQMTDICGIPGNGGRCKWPKLGEAYEHATGKKLENAHDALADVTACKDIYFWLKKGVAA